LEDSLSGSNTLLIIEKSMVEFTKWWMVRNWNKMPILKERHDRTITNHQYYFQCLGVMALCQLPFVNFIVYIHKKIFV
jgi:hypothetical protein